MPRLVFKAYSPTQPRVPKGYRGAGRWCEKNHPEYRFTFYQRVRNAGYRTVREAKNAIMTGKEPGKFDGAFMRRLVEAPDKAIVGKMGDFLRGQKLRELYRDVLDVEVGIMHAPPEAGDFGGRVWLGGFGRASGEPIILVNNLHPMELIWTLLHEGAHAMRALGRGRELAQVENSQDWDSSVQERSAQEMAEYALKLEDVPTHWWRLPNDIIQRLGGKAALKLARQRRRGS